MVEVEFAVDLEYELVADRKGWIEIEMEWWLGLGLDLDNGQVDHVAPHEEKVVGATKNDLKSKVTTTIITILNYPQNEFKKWCFYLKNWQGLETLEGALVNVVTSYSLVTSDVSNHD